MNSTLRRRSRRDRELDLLRIMCASGTLLNSEISAAPITEQTPPAEPAPGGIGAVPPGREGDRGGEPLPGVFAE